MRLLSISLVLVLTVAAAGCFRKPGGEWGESQTPTKKKLDMNDPMGRWELADQATAERVASAGTAYLEGPNSRLRNVEFVNVAKPIATQRNGKPAEAVYVQFRAINNLADPSLHQRELLIIQGDQVLEYWRTPDEISNRMTSVWLKKNPPPQWPNIDRLPDQK
jgi:hypothetical protein